MSYIGNSPGVSVTPTSTTTFTGKTIDLTDNTVTGTKAEFDSACSDGNFVYVSDIGTSVQAYDAQLADVAGLTPTDNGVIIGNGTNFVVESGATFRTSVGLAIGTDVQAYDADTAKLDVAQTWTGAQRGTVTTDNDLSFDQSVSNNFSCTPSGAGTLTFTNHTAGQSGMILLVNGSNYAIAAAATTKITAADLATISTTGTYLISYFDNGTNAYCVCSGNVA